MKIATKESQLFFHQTELELSEASKKLVASIQENPAVAEQYVQLGISLRGQMLMNEAIEAYSEGLTYDPFYVPLYRHRGHAYVNVRRYREAAADFELALRLEPTNWDCWYHLALSYFLMENYQRAAEAYAGCMKVSHTPERKIAPTDWYYMTLNILGRTDEAEALVREIGEGLEAGDSAGYYDRVLVYKGVLSPEAVIEKAEKLDDHMFATYCYGIARYYLQHGQEAKAKRLMERICERGTLWSGFAEQAAERDLKEWK